jgi:hypothetical protein
MQRAGKDRAAQEANSRDGKLLPYETLREAAERVGGTVVVVGHVGPLAVVADVASLMTLSEIVALGEPRRIAYGLTNDERSIATVVEFQLIEVIKGAVSSASLSVVLPGGRIDFGRGRAAEVRVIGLEPLTVNRRYVLFLRRLDSSDRLTQVATSASPQTRYRLTAGAQGVLMVDRYGKISSQAQSSAVWKAYHRRPLGEVMDSLRSVAAASKGL